MQYWEAVTSHQARITHLPREAVTSHGHMSTSDAPLLKAAQW